MTTRLSLVIPAYNEAELLPRLLASVDRARLAFDPDPEAVEVIVADNQSTDGTATLAEAAGCRVARVEKRVIGAVRNGGARLATGEWLAFVDADSELDPQVFVALARALADPSVVGGSSGVRSERWSLGIVATWALMLPMVWLTGFDTGVVFCRRADFEALGGYDERRPYAEDVDFLVRLRRLGRARRQRLCRLRGVKTLTSARKFDRHGDWHYLTQMPRLAWQTARDPTRLSDFARRYWYEDR